MTSVTIPDSVTNIGEEAFAYCYSLTGVYFEGNAPSFAWNVLCDTYPTVYYLPGTTGWDTYFGEF